MGLKRASQRPRSAVPPDRTARPATGLLQELLSTARGQEQGGRPASVELRSHLVRRRGRVRPGVGRRPGAVAEAGAGLPGYAFNVPAPPAGRLLWAEISFPWQYWEWDGWGPSNHSSSNLRIEGSVDCAWILTGNPSEFPAAPEFMSDGGHFEFYTTVPPGGEGFSAAWLAEPYEKTFPSKRSKVGVPSPLEQLLSVRDGNVLRLWVALAFRDAELDDQPWEGPGAFSGGPQAISVNYAYLGPALAQGDFGGGAKVGW
jgi:hypothetical protein